MKFNHLPHRDKSNALIHLSPDASQTLWRKFNPLSNEKLSSEPKLIKTTLVKTALEKKVIELIQ